MSHGDSELRAPIAAFDHAHQAVQSQGIQNNYFGAISEASALPVSLGVPLGRRDGRYPLRGREELLNFLEECWSNPDKPRVCVLYGLGGSGKSQAALEFAHRMRQRGVEAWWLVATDQTQLSAGMQALAHRVGITPQDSIRGDNADLLWAHLESRKEPWLLVVDNTDDVSVLDFAGRKLAEGAGWIRPLSSGLGMVIVTSRDGRLNKWGTWSRQYQVGPLEADSAASVLIDYAGADAGNYEEAVALARQVGFLPLALRLIGAYLAHIRSIPSAFLPQTNSAILTSFEEYRRALIGDQARTLEIITSEVLSQETAEQLIRWPWEHSLEHLEASGETYARPLLRLLSHLEDAPVPYELILSPSRLAKSPLFSGITGISVWQALNELSRFGLIDLEVSNTQAARRPATLVIHPLVRATGRRTDSLKEYFSYQGLVTKLLHIAAHDAEISNPFEPSTWPQWQSLTPHALPLFREAAANPQTPKPTVVLLAHMAYLSATALHAQGHYYHAEVELRKVLETEVGFLGAEHRHALMTRFALAGALSKQDRPEEAEAEYRKVLEVEMRTRGAEHPDTLATRYQVAHMAAHQGRYSEAETEYRKILEAKARILGAEHHNTLAVWHTITNAMAAQGRHVEAEAEYRKILEIEIRVRGLRHRHTLTTRYTLARAMAAQGRHVEAEAEYREVLKARVQILGADHPDTLDAHHMLARAMAAQGRHVEAEAEYQEVLKARVQILGADHPDTLATRKRLAELLSRMK